MANNLILVGQSQCPSPNDVRKNDSNMPHISDLGLYAKTAEEYCDELLNLAEAELMKGRVDAAIHQLKLEIYFATAALGQDHSLTKAGERAVWSLNQLRSPDLALYVLDMFRTNIPSDS
jgi:hypothetical protein